MWDLAFSILAKELSNKLSLNSAKEEGHYDTVGCNESSANPSPALYPLINNTINNHDDDVYSSDGAKNEDCDDHTEKVRSSTVKCVSSENKDITYHNHYFFIRVNVKKMLEVVLS